MQNRIYFIFLVLGILLSSVTFAQLIYVSPSAGSKFQNPETGIILKSQNPVDLASLSKKNLFHIEGSLTGIHKFEIKLVQDNRTIILQPIQKFMEGETVTVSVGNKIQLESGENINGTSFQFSTRAPRTEEQKQRISAFMEKIQA